MSFFKELRRRSKPNFRTSPSYQESSQSNGDLSGVSTVDSSQSSQKTSPPSLAQDQPALPATKSKVEVNENGNGSSPIPPQRPVPISLQSSRSSVVGVHSASQNELPRHHAPISPYAPRIESISDNSWVHQKVLLVYGQIGDAYRHSVNGTLTVIHPHDSFPSTVWPVRESYFKALVHLVPGPNKIRLDYTPSKTTHHTVHSSSININYLPLTNVPPLHLAIVLADDSTGQFDTAPGGAPSDESSCLDLAIRKFRMAAYLWQAFTGEQMYRNNFGRRCFRFEEEWQTGTLSAKDTETGQMRNEATVHIIRVPEAVAALRLYAHETLCRVVANAVIKHFDLKPGQNQYVSALFLDSHWDKECNRITGDLVAGSSEGAIKMALFGSAGLHSYPSCMEEVVSAFTDCKRTDPEYVASQYGSNWETAASCIGAHLRETGRLLGCFPRDTGIMGPDYVRFNRSFTTWEPFRSGTKSQGLRLCLSADEADWHRLDVLRFRFHPLFRLPSDAQVPDDSVEVWPVENDKILVTSGSGVAFVEIFVEDEAVCANFIEYVNADAGNSAIPRQVTLTEQGIRHRLPAQSKKAKRIRLVIYSGKLRIRVVDDLSQLKSKRSLVMLSKHQTGYRGGMIEFPLSKNDCPEDLVLESCIQTKLLVSVKVYLDNFVTGIEFGYEDLTSQLFGKKTSHPATGEFVLDTRRGEVILGFYVRFDRYLEGLEILTSLGRKSGVYGSPSGGVSRTLIPPRGYRVAGISGSVGSYIDSFALIITR
ncbi:hypothetical protein VTO42DRAFT_5361 [Malbranchea cinnamomea]